MKQLFQQLEKKQWVGILLTMTLSLIVLMTLFGDVFFSLNNKCFQNGGDGLQSYYNSIYHAKNDSSYVICTTMNYPYGEHVLYTNGHVPIVFAIKFISNTIVDISDYTIGILNFVMLFSFCVAAIFLYLIFRELKLDFIFSVAVAIGIAFLSPQIQRLTGHYGLAYGFVVPGALYALLKFHNKQSMLRAFLISGYIFIVALIHPYNLLITAPFIGFYLAVLMFVNRKNIKELAKLFIYLAIIICLPYLLIGIWDSITFPVSDRTMSPWGFFVYHSGWEGVFTGGYFTDSVFTFLFNTAGSSWEGSAFLGHVAIVMYFALFSVFAIVPFLLTKQAIGFTVIVPVVLLLLYIFKRNLFFRIFRPTSNFVLNVMLWAAFIMLIFSFCMPFKIYPPMLNYLGPFRQFRALGRFTWLLFYAVNIVSFYTIYTFFSNRAKIRAIVMSVAVLILFTNAYYNIVSINRSLNNDNIFVSEKSEYKTLAKQIDFTKYQAVVSIPMTHVGSENYWVYNNEFSIIDWLFPLCYEAKLPIVGAFLSRTSISQSVDALILSQEPYSEPKILSGFKSKKPLVLLVPVRYKPTWYEQNIISNAQLITETKEFRLYRIDYKYYTERISLQQKQINCEFAGWKDSSKTTVYANLDSSSAQHHYKGAGAKEFTANVYSSIIETTVSDTDTSTVICSFWFYGSKIDLYPAETIVVTNIKHDNEPEYEEYLSLHKGVVLFDGDWCLVEYPVHLKAGSNKIRIVLTNPSVSSKSLLTVDEIMIRPAGKDFYKRCEKEINKNNRFYPIINNTCN